MRIVDVKVVYAVVEVKWHYIVVAFENLNSASH